MSACERVVGLTVREASQGDAAAIAGVHVRAWRVAYRGLLPDDLLDRLSVEDREESWRGILGDAGDESFTLIAIDGERQLVGFCVVAAPARDVDAGEQTAEVAATYVDPHRWRAGIGSDLLAAAVSRLREGGWRHVVLWVFGENARACAFYWPDRNSPPGLLCLTNFGVSVRLRGRSGAALPSVRQPWAPYFVVPRSRTARMKEDLAAV